MIEDQIFDYNDKKNSQIIYLQQLSKTSGSIYTLLLLIVIVCIALLPFIHIDLTSSAVASVGSNLLTENITAPFSGKIENIKLVDNKHISKGDTVFEINCASTNTEISYTKNRARIIEQSLHDLSVLRQVGDQSHGPKLLTTQYQAECAHFLEQKAQLSEKYESALQNYNRYSLLYKGKVVSTSEYETYVLAYKQAIAEQKLLETQTQSQWQTEQFQLNQELNDLKIKNNQLDEVVKNSVIIANLSGTGYKEDGIQTGVYVQSGQKIAQIYPDSNLVLECLVEPKDIGFIKPNQKVRVQIDAYNYNEWGMLNARVFELGKDVNVINNKPYYIVKCTLAKPYLTLKNGYKGKIIKGMTGRANFYLASRTIWQLLFSKVNDWLDPKAN